MMAVGGGMAVFERIVIGDDNAADETLIVDPAAVWFLSIDERLVGVLDGSRTFIARSRRPIEVRSVPPPRPEVPGVPVWESAGIPLRAVPLGALATEDEPVVPRLAPVTEAGDRILADVRAGTLSPFVLQRFLRRAVELQFRLAREGREADAPSEAAALEAELRSGAAR